MPAVLRVLRGLFAFAAFVTFSPSRSFAQSDSSSAAFPEAPAPAPTQTAPAPAPVAQPAAQPAAPAPAPAPAPPATAPPPAPAPAPAAATAPPAAYQPDYGAPPPPPPERPKDEGFEMPPFSVRIDPFRWLLDGQLGFELEVGVLDFMSVELVPMFVTNEEPPTFDIFAGREDPISRESDGIGPLAGTSIGLGFWLEGKPLKGYVLRAIFTNYAYHYKATDPAGEFDNVSHVERHFYGYFGSHARWGAFTLAGGIGLGAELNKEERCFRNDPPEYTPTRNGCDGALLIKATRGSNTQPPDAVDLNGGLGGVQLLFRFSLGVTFD